MNKFLYVFAFLIIVGIQMPAYAYIDPGTGSMLFSVLLGSCATLFFLINSVWIKLKTIFFTSKNLEQNSVPFVIYSEGNQYFNVFKPVVDEFEKREIPLVYYTSQKNDKFFDYNFKYVKCEYLGLQNKAFFKLAFLKADICLMTIPQLDVLHLKRSKFVKHYSHIFHAISCSIPYRLFGLDYYDSVLLDGEFQIPSIRKLETKRNLPKKDLVVVGSTYMDFLAAKKSENTEKQFTILLAPSWGPDGLLTKFGTQLIDELIKLDKKIIIRPHPQSLKVEKNLIEKIQKKYQNNNIEWDLEPDNFKSLSGADVLISDFSSILFDYAFLFNKPFIYSISELHDEMYDRSDLDEEDYRFSIMKEIGKELTLENFKQIKSIINDINDSVEIKTKIQQAKDITWQNRGLAAKNVVDFLVKKQKELSEC